MPSQLKLPSAYAEIILVVISDESHRDNSWEAKSYDKSQSKDDEK